MHIRLKFRYNTIKLIDKLNRIREFVWEEWLYARIFGANGRTQSFYQNAGKWLLMMPNNLSCVEHR